MIGMFISIVNHSDSNWCLALQQEGTCCVVLTAALSSLPCTVMNTSLEAQGFHLKKLLF